MTAEVLKFLNGNCDVALSLLKTASGLEKTSPSKCIAIQRRAIALMTLEINEARYVAFVVQRTLNEITKD